MAASACHDPGRERVREPNGRAQVDGQRGVDLLRGKLVQASGGGQRGVGHQHVDLAGLLEEDFDRRGVAEVGGQRAPAHRGGQTLEHVGAPAGEHERGAARCEGSAVTWPIPPSRP